MIVLSLGSNKRNRLRYIEEAIFLLKKIYTPSSIKFSSVYNTPPYGIKDQPDFLNMIVILEGISPNEDDLLKVIKRIELQIGRTYSRKWGPREIDIDIIYYDSKIVKKGNLCIPHTDLYNREFVLVPLCELIPEFIDPVKKKQIVNILEDFYGSNKRNKRYV